MADAIYRIGSNEAGVLVAVGANGLVLRSGDGGTSWAFVNAGTTNHLYGVAYGAPLGVGGWIIVGQNGLVLTSTDGISWVTRAPFTGVDLYDVAYGGVFLVVGVGGMLALSDDMGATWSEKPAGTFNDLFDVSIDLGSYIIVGDNDTVLTGEILALDSEELFRERLQISEAMPIIGEFNITFADSMQVADSIGWRVAGQKVSFTVSGTVEAGDQYTITLGGVNYTYTVQAGDTTLAQVAAGLAALITPATTTKYFSTVSGNTVTVTSIDPPTPYTYDSSVTDAGTIDAAITETFVQNSSNQQYALTFSGSFVIGGTVSVFLNGTEYQTAIASTNPDVVAAAVAATIDALAGYEATVAGAVVTITQTSPVADYTCTATTPSGAVAVVMTQAFAGQIEYYEWMQDNLIAADQHLTTAEFNVTFADSLLIADPLFTEHIGWHGGRLALPGIALTGTILGGSAMTGRLQLPGLRLTGTITRPWAVRLRMPGLRISGTFCQDARLTGRLALPGLRLGGTLATMVAVFGSEVAVWVVNAKTGAPSTFTNFDCQGIVNFNGVWLGFFADGIYELTGDKDGAVNIDARIAWPPSNLGTTNPKRLDLAEVKVRRKGSAQLKLTVTADEQTRRIYTKQLNGQAGIAKHPVALAKGIEAEFWQMVVENVDGGDLAIAEILVDPDILSY